MVRVRVGHHQAYSIPVYPRSIAHFTLRPFYIPTKHNPAVPRPSVLLYVRVTWGLRRRADTHVVVCLYAHRWPKDPLIQWMKDVFNYRTISGK